ncbi:ADP-ribosylation factor-like protein 6-interacting protein 4 [Hordeum vulgare subsp. vulgare]|uniref:ADP-ribosylation factor-like protein 6-interacting protein 4 n=1 Tax=Hordeum vulgare subsp. vulgare TaxID=112509 RepID=UPI001D1A4A7D|nr:ADP-ribosylation factor-like protein 6-interacting protein 4 [Hordeum vulgare subsp. vulgare]
MGFCCGPSDVKVLPNSISSLSPSSSSSSSASAKDSGDGGKKKQQQGVKKEQCKEKKKSKLDQAAMSMPRFPFHSRPGLM